MYTIEKSIEQGFPGQPGGLYDILTQLQNLTLGNQGAAYFVEGNTGSDGYDGSSWDRAFKTLAYAIGVSNTYISAKHYASRNSIFIRGSFDEDLVVLPQKTDIIGVGSTNATPTARILGTQAFEATGWGSRLINIWFQDDGASATVTLTAGGTEFHNCWFSGVGSTVGTYGLYITNPGQVRIIGCYFSPYLENPFSTAAIALIADGQYNNVLVENNIIHGATGIYCSDNALNNQFDCLIRNNYIKSTTFCINDDTDDYAIVGNRMITATTMAGGLDINAALACDNIITGSDGSRLVPSTDQEY